MTEEEMAEEYAKGLCKTCSLDTCRNNTLHTCSIKEYIKQAFLAGVKAGKDTNVSTKWHDLRKDPNDLPKRNNELTDRSDVIITDKGIAHYNFRKQKWYVHNVECDMSFSEVVIAWCEIPKYTEE